MACDQYLKSPDVQISLLHGTLYLTMHRPYSEQRHDRNESEAVRDRLIVFLMESAVKTVLSS